jgi:hypothetical protein
MTKFGEPSIVEGYHKLPMLLRYFDHMASLKAFPSRYSCQAGIGCQYNIGCNTANERITAPKIDKTPI